ncbi:hypothetical protein D3C74_410080 [compost metagenome]
MNKIDGILYMLERAAHSDMLAERQQLQVKQILTHTGRRWRIGRFSRIPNQW